MAGFNHEAYANACVSMAVRHKNDGNWEAIPTNVMGAWMHGEEDHINELYNRIGLPELTDELIEYISSWDRLDSKEQVAAMTYIGIILSQSIEPDNAVWHVLMDNIGWQPGARKHIAEYIELEQMFKKMNIGKS